jgi:hypothetical protein
MRRSPACPRGARASAATERSTVKRRRRAAGVDESRQPDHLGSLTSCARRGQSGCPATRFPAAEPSRPSRRRSRRWRSSAGLATLAPGTLGSDARRGIDATSASGSLESPDTNVCARACAGTPTAGRTTRRTRLLPARLGASAPLLWRRRRNTPRKRRRSPPGSGRMPATSPVTPQESTIGRRDSRTPGPESRCLHLVTVLGFGLTTGSGCRASEPGGGGSERASPDVPTTTT